jgi:diadenosine tetraphosphate (Ap4A) HIT family hydrolase
VPEVTAVSELYQLNQTQQAQFMAESCYLAEQLADLFKADKMNIASIGNIVPQLHIHHIVRYQTDAAWPAPVWGKFPAVPYSDTQRRQRISQLKTQLGSKLQVSND